ncbi:uncharacterized protein NPIL_590921 [Nephila pilipes]|uniref:Uncharacterized protein n=1 Tax=Nephila pilipes TaxID=299642 RepID=A0A8X6UR64_NEPPI|nr:uncharacterized protein NPIL_590921 [Nephila pilipes]
MNGKFWPSLQLIAHVKIALGILRNFEFSGILTDFTFEYVANKLQDIHQNLTSLPLPNVMKNRTVCIIGAMGKEIKKWYDYHMEFLLGENLDFWNRIHWHSHGTINRFETARSFIQVGNINIRLRFYLACAFYFEEDVQNLWKLMNEECQTDIIRNCFTCSRFLWLDAVQSRTALDWSRISHVLQTEDFLENNHLSFDFDDIIGFHHIFRRLQTPSARLESFLFAISSGDLHQYDLYLCLFQMEARELEILLNRLSDGMRVIMLATFLHWPFQNLFLFILERFPK